MIRNSYERAMSSLRMMLGRDRAWKQSLDELVDKPAFQKKSVYKENIPAWEGAFPATQILYIPFGRVKSDPDGVLHEVERYLGLERFDSYPVISGKVNATGKKKIEIPDSISEKIRRMTAPQYPYLTERFGEAFVSILR